MNHNLEWGSKSGFGHNFFKRCRQKYADENLPLILSVFLTDIDPGGTSWVSYDTTYDTPMTPPRKKIKGSRILEKEGTVASQNRNKKERPHP